MKLPYGYSPGQLLITPIVTSATRRLDIYGPNEDSANNAINTLNTFAATGTTGFTHSWVVAEAFEDTSRWTHEV